MLAGDHTEAMFHGDNNGIKVARRSVKQVPLLCIVSWICTMGGARNEDTLGQQQLSKPDVSTFAPLEICGLLMHLFYVDLIVSRFSSARLTYEDLQTQLRARASCPANLLRTASVSFSAIHTQLLEKILRCLAAFQCYIPISIHSLHFVAA